MSGAPLRTYNVLRRLARDNEVYLAAFTASEEQREGVSHLLEFCQEVVTVKLTSMKEMVHLGKMLTCILRWDPPELRLGFSEDLARKIRELTERVDFDIVQIEHGSMGMYLEALPAELRKRAVWTLHDIDFDKFMRLARIEKNKSTKLRAWIHAMTMRRWQPRVAACFGYCVTMSEADRQLLLAANGSLAVGVSPNGVDTRHYCPLPDEGNASEILFIGNMGYRPNADAAIYFCNQVLPLIRRNVPDIKVWIVGINPGTSVKQLQGSGVCVTGSVSDVVPYYKRSKICVVPLRAGSGTRLKILEAMALGRVVVSTSIGCEGLNVVDGEHIVVANDSRTFAEQTVRLLASDELRAKIAANARAFVVASYDWDVIVEKLMSDFDRIVREQSRMDAVPMN
jgi:sugar transferase (PEP-CTERM/EpsH1 system associated)